MTRFVDSIKFVSLGEMSAGVAHELNSPLTAIVGIPAAAAGDQP